MKRRWSLKSGAWAKLAGAALLACVAGCGGSQPKTYPVTGTVTSQGKPLPDAIVTFVPEQGRHASGVTDAEGKFTLTTVQPGDGAMAGRYRVIVSEKPAEMAEGDYSEPAETQTRIPIKYAEPIESGLSFEVKPDAANEYPIVLTE